MNDFFASQISLAATFAAEILKKVLTKLINMRNLKCFLLSAILMTICSWASAQTEIHGTVTDPTGETVIGATVMEKGTSNGTVTDFDGNFTLKVAPGKTLVFSYVGFQTMEVAAADGMQVQLQEDANELNEVVVTGYTSEKKADLTGSVSVVKMKDIADVPTGNVLSSLNGRVAGVNITTDGTPGGGSTSTLVRGTTTINNSSPLYVIDGIMTRENVGSILSSNDVESIQVLKDASSAAIYGAQAANGVIIITTKRAKKGEVHIDFDASLTAQKFVTNYDLLNAQQWGDVYWQAYKYSNGTTPSSLVYGNGENAQLNTTTPYYTNPETGETFTATSTDWLKTMHKTALMQNYSLTLSKGSENGSSSLSLNWIDQDGLVKETDYQRFNARVTSDYHFLDNKLRVGESVAINRWKEHVTAGGLEELLVAIHPAIPQYGSQGGWGGGYIDVLGDKANPLRLQQNESENRHEYWRVFGNVYLEVEPIKALVLRSNFGVNYYDGKQSMFVPKWTESARSVDNNELTSRNDYALDWVWTNTAAYTLTKGGHTANFLAGMEAKRRKTELLLGYGTGMTIEDINYRYLNTTTSGARNEGIASKYSMVSYFGKVNYSFEGRYLAAFTLRRDASSRFGKNHNSGVFPSVSGGWRISDEKFMEKTRSWLNDLKLRASWGVNGNDEIDNEATYTKYLVDLARASYNLSGNNTTLTPGALRDYTGNANLRWEQTRQVNIGFDAMFLKNRLSVAFDYFWKNTKDMLFQPPYAAVQGEGGYTWENCVAMKNRGYEIVIGWHDRLENGLTYGIDFNAAAYKNKITELPQSIYYTFGNGTPDHSAVGQPFNSWMGYKTDGVFRTQQEVDEYRAQYDVQIGDPQVGRIKYLDVNGDGKINTADQTWLGCDQPKFTAGLNLSAAWKGFDVALFFNGMKRKAWNNSKYYTDLFQLWTGNHSTRLLNALHAWENYEETGVYNSSTPALTLVNSNNEDRSSDFYVEDGSFIKLKTFTLGYTLPQQLVSKAHISRARVYFQMQNVFTITDYTGADPEGLGYTYPLPRTFTFGLSVSL